MYIDPKEHVVDVTNLDAGASYREKYGKLLIATGAQPILLPFIDKPAEGIFNVHDIEDLRQILAYIQQRHPRTAAIIGAGNIGLELTEAMHKLKIDVLLFDIRKTPAAALPSKPSSKKMVILSSNLAWFDFAYAPPYAPVWNALISAAVKASQQE